MVNQKTVLITGASSGFGLACVNLFLENDWRVIATLRNAATRADKLFSNHPNLTVNELDITNEDDRAQLATLIDTEFEGECDCLINNAGYGAMGVLESISNDEVIKQMNVNFVGLTCLIQQLLPALRKAKGRIINLSSVLGYSGFPLASLYSASKFAVEGLSESLYYELAPHHVQVAIVQPGRHRTEFGNNLQRYFPETIDNQLYNNQMKNYIDLLNNNNLKVAGSAEQVAQKILKLATMKKMPLRTRIGLDAQITYWLSRFLPRRVFTALLRKSYNRLLNKSTS